MSIYLKDSEGLSETNMLLLEEASVALNSLKGPWVVGGDWNLFPDELHNSKWRDESSLAIQASAEGGRQALCYSQAGKSKKS